MDNSVDDVNKTVGHPGEGDLGALPLACRFLLLPFALTHRPTLR